MTTTLRTVTLIARSQPRPPRRLRAGHARLVGVAILVPVAVLVLAFPAFYRG